MMQNCNGIEERRQRFAERAVDLAASMVRATEPEGRAGLWWLEVLFDHEGNRHPRAGVNNPVLTGNGAKLREDVLDDIRRDLACLLEAVMLEAAGIGQPVAFAPVEPPAVAGRDAA